MWGRDGAFIAAALDKAGYAEPCRKFFDFCSRALDKGGYLFQHYNPDGSVASNWHARVLDGKEVLPIQEDSTALLLWALWIHYECSKDIEFIRPLYEKFILKCADFLVVYRDAETLLPTPSYDLWEERYGVHAYTVATVISGLRGAANFASVFQDVSRAEAYTAVADQMTDGIVTHLYHAGQQRYARSGYRTANGYELDEVIDACSHSRLSAYCLRRMHGSSRRWRPYGNNSYRIPQSGESHAITMTSISGSMTFRPMFLVIPGFISTLWLGEYEIVRAENLEQLHEALPYLEWCAQNAPPSGVLAEQVHPIQGHPLSVSPLTWSHSSFVWAVLLYVEKFHALGGKA